MRKLNKHSYSSLLFPGHSSSSSLLFPARSSSSSSLLFPSPFFSSLFFLGWVRGAGKGRGIFLSLCVWVG